MPRFHTTNRQNAERFASALIRAGYARVPLRDRAEPIRELAERTFTATIYRDGGRPVYTITYAHNASGPLPPRRKYGRDRCSIPHCDGRVHGRGKCKRHLWREKYWTNEAFRERSRARARASWHRRHPKNQQSAA